MLSNGLSKGQMKKRFSQRVENLVKKGTTYLDAISTIAKELDLHESSVPSLIDKSLKDKLEKEVRKQRLLK